MNNFYIKLPFSFLLIKSMILVIPILLVAVVIYILKQRLYFKVENKSFSKKLKISFSKMKISEHSVYVYKTIEGNECFRVIRFPFYYRLILSEGFKFQNRDLANINELKLKKNMILKITDPTGNSVIAVTRISKSEFK